MKFTPKSVNTFHFRDCTFDPLNARAIFRYSLDDQWHFQEELHFPNFSKSLSDTERSALEHALRYLHLMLGISYFKTAVPPKIEVHTAALPKEAADFFNKAYEKGLGEFAYTNKLSLKGKIQFPYSATQALAPHPLKLERRKVVPLGGGKDSLVSLELLRDSSDTPSELCTLTLGDWSVIRDIVPLTQVPHLTVMRRVDPLLIELNTMGALNGHVPFSAMLAFLLPVCGILYGFDTAIMSQERSANVGSIVEDGSEVNHQYSKSFEFEQDFSSFVKAAIFSHFSYFSLLRPLSELHIAKLFSKYEQYHSVFTSCNKAFRIQSRSVVKRWCGDCPKCRFVFLILAPFVERDRLTKMFGDNLLANKAQREGFRELVGLSGHKPFECVGEIEESQHAVRLLMDKTEWKDDVVLSELGKELDEKQLTVTSTPMRPLALETSLIPAELRAIIHADL